MVRHRRAGARGGKPSAFIQVVQLHAPANVALYPGPLNHTDAEVLLLAAAQYASKCALNDLRIRLDSGPLEAGARRVVPNPAPEGLRPVERLSASHAHEYIILFSSGTTLSVPDGFVWCWASLRRFWGGRGRQRGRRPLEPGNQLIDLVQEPGEPVNLVSILD